MTTFDLLSRLLAQPLPYRRKQLRKTRLDSQLKTRQLLKQTVYLLCKEHRQRAWELVAGMDRRRFMFSEQGEFIPQGATAPITGSNVKTIIQYILMKADERKEEPVGFPEFCRQYMDVIDKACETPQRRAKRVCSTKPDLTV